MQRMHVVMVSWRLHSASRLTLPFTHYCLKSSSAYPLDSVLVLLLQVVCDDAVGVVLVPVEGRDDLAQLGLCSAIKGAWASGSGLGFWIRWGGTFAVYYWHAKPSLACHIHGIHGLLGCARHSGRHQAANPAPDAHLDDLAQVPVLWPQEHVDDTRCHSSRRGRRWQRGSYDAGHRLHGHGVLTSVMQCLGPTMPVAACMASWGVMPS